MVYVSPLRINSDIFASATTKKVKGMAKIEKVNTVHDYNAYVGQADEHRLASVINYDDLPPIRHSLNSYGIYGLFLREDTLVDLTYGCGRYDYDESTLICVAPGQTGGKEDNGERVALKGWALLFHPDLIRGTFLEGRMHRYSFFAYNVNEALHMRPGERDILVACLKLIKQEFHAPGDGCRDSIIVGLIDIVLQYCSRFYNRQFSSHRQQNSDILTRFEQLMHSYYDSERQLTDGLPTVQACASELCLSSNYFADLIKKQTGITAGEHIHRFVMSMAKSRLTAGEQVCQVAYALGFEYPQHFSRLFKKMEGCTPSEYIASRNRRPDHRSDNANTGATAG